MEKLPILYEDKHMILVDKPAGIAVERDRYRNPSVEGRIADYFNTLKLPHNTIIGIAHRLDRPVGGVMLVAKKKSVLVDINKQFEVGTIKKIYYAITESKPEKLKGTLNNFIYKDVANKKAIIFDKTSRSRVACSLDYKYMGETGFGSLIQVMPHTGKFHQIRAQFAYIGCPLVGDEKYGAKNPFKELTIGLHAFSLTFMHPIDKIEMTIEAPLPEEWQLINPE